MRYFLLRRQKGQGCDYTIGCGLDFEEIEADSREEAISEILDEENDALWWVEPGEFEMEEVSLFEVRGTIDLIPILKKKLAEEEAHKASLQAKEQEAAELAQYEKLKKKFAK